MKNVTIVIPTRNRFDKLQACLKSIPPSLNIEVVVICDGDRDTYERLTESQEACFNVLEVIHLREQIGSVAARNKFCHDVNNISIVNLLTTTAHIAFSCIRALAIHSHLVDRRRPGTWR